MRHVIVYNGFVEPFNVNTSHAGIFLSFEPYIPEENNEKKL